MSRAHGYGSADPQWSDPGMGDGLRRFFRVLIYISVMVGIAVLISIQAGCDLPVMQYHLDYDPDYVDPQQATPPDTCQEDTLYLLPEFKTSLFEIEEEVTYGLEFHLGPHTYIIAPQEHAALPGIIDSIMEIWHPEYGYRICMVSDTGRFSLSVIADGTNDHMAWYFDTYVRYQGVKHYWGWSRQSFGFQGACDEDQYNELINLYPSVNRFNFFKTHYDSLTYIKFASKILGQCKQGRERADFRWMPIAMPDSIVQLYIDQGWNQVWPLGSNPPDRLAWTDDMPQLIIPDR